MTGSCTITNAGVITCGAAGTAGGDLSGTFPNPSVAQIEGAAIPTSAFAIGTNSSKQLVANQPFQVKSKTTTYQVLASDFVGCDNIVVPSGTFTITLVASSSQPASGQCVQIINYGSGVVTVAPSGQQINGSSSSLTLAAGSASAATSVTVFSDGTNYVGQTYATTGSGSGISSSTAGQPLIATGSTTGSSSTVFLDCTKFSGSSPAAQINACVAAAPTGGVLDARGFPCYTGSNAQTWDQGVVLGFTGAGGSNGEGHTLLLNSCTAWNVTITDAQTVPLTIHPQSGVITTNEGVNSGNGFNVASSANFPELIAADCDTCWLKISAISRTSTTVTVTTSVSGPTISAKPVLVYGVTDATDFANGIKSMTGSGTSYTYTEAGTATSSSGGAAGFGYTGYHGAVTIKGVNALIGSSPTMLYGLHLYGAQQGTFIGGNNFGCPANGVGFEVDGDGTSVGPLDIPHDTVDCASSTLSTPLEITTRGSGGQMGGVNVVGGLYAHEGTGKPDIRIADDGGNYQNLGVNLYDVGIEDGESTAQGLLIQNADNVNVYAFTCGSATGNGTNCVTITGSSMTNINLHSIYQTGAYANTINDTSNSQNRQLTQARIPFYGYGTSNNPAKEWMWCASTSANCLVLDNSGVGEANHQPQSGSNFAKTTASLQTWESIPIYASQIISFDCKGFWQGSTTAATLGLAVTTPASPTNIAAWAKIDTTATNTSTSSAITASATAFVGGTPNAATTSYPFSIYGTVENGTTAGSLAIQAENGAASGTMNIIRGSYCHFYHQ
jgi:hypothetical protein